MSADMVGEGIQGVEINKCLPLPASVLPTRGQSQLREGSRLCIRGLGFVSSQVTHPWEANALSLRFLIPKMGIKSTL